MFIEANKTKYHISRHGSVFSRRTGKQDCYISKKRTYGARQSDGNRYVIIQIIASESGEILRDYDKLPNEITIELLRQWGFVDGI